MSTTVQQTCATPRPTPRPTLRNRMLTVHRWLSLGAAAFWLLQAFTGILIVFHWEITDAALSDIHRPTDLAAIERRIDTLAPAGSGGRMSAIWNTAGAGDRYDLYYADAAGESRSARIAGDGTILDRPREGENSVMDVLIGLHHDLFGAWGSWIVSISGLLLCSNLLLGLVAAWPRRGTWRLALRPATRGPTTARLYSWHRAIGLWVVLPALVVAATGTMLKFEEGIGTLIGAEPVLLPANPPRGPAVGFAAVASAALGVIPGSTLTNVTWPEEGDATYRVLLRAPGEIRRAYGGSIVLVDANDGTVRGLYPIADAPPARAFMSALFPIHTGEAAGLVGRLLSITIGLWLISMIVMGGLLWYRRRKSRAKAS